MKIKKLIHNIVSVLLAGTMFVSTVCFPELYAWAEDTEVPATADWYDGSLTRLEISNQADMVAFYNAVLSGKTFEGMTVSLTADIDMSTVSNFASIGFVSLSSFKVFSGVFEGNDYTLTLGNRSAIGLFSYLSGAVIRNLTVAGNVSVTTTNYGVFAANAANASKIINCVNKANVTCSGNNAVVAGFVAVADKETALTGCINMGSITGTETGACVSGFFGKVVSNSVTAADCINLGTLTSTLNCAGFVALYGSASNRVSLTRCISAGKIVSSGTDKNCRTAGFIASLPYAELTDCLMLAPVTDAAGTFNGAFSTGDCTVTAVNSYINTDICSYGVKTTAADLPESANYYACRKTTAELVYNGASSPLTGSGWAYLAPVPVGGTNLTEYFYPLPASLTGRCSFTSVIIDSEMNAVANAVIVTSAEQLTGENKTFILAGDISLTEPIESFTGTLYGCGHTVTLALSQTGSGASPTGLGMFRTLSGRVYDLNITGTVTTDEALNVGSVAGEATNGAVISRCVSSAAISAGSALACGGFIGTATGSVLITDCAAKATGVAAGFAGSISADSTLTLTNSYVAVEYPSAFYAKKADSGVLTDTNSFYLSAADSGSAMTAASMQTADFASTLGDAWTGSDLAYPEPSAKINAAGTDFSALSAADGVLSVARPEGAIDFTGGNNTISSSFGLTAATGSLSAVCATPGVIFESLDEKIITISGDLYTITGSGSARIRVSLPETAASALKIGYILVGVGNGTLTEELFTVETSLTYNGEVQCEIVAPSTPIEGLEFSYSSDGVTYYSAESFKTAFASTGYKRVNDPAAPYTIYYMAHKEGFDDFESAAHNFNITKATPELTFANPNQSKDFTGSAANITAPVLTLCGSDTYAASDISYSYKVNGTGAPIDGLPSARGIYTVTAVYAGSDDYESASAELSLTIGYGSFGFTPVPYNAPYDGNFHTISFTDLPDGSVVEYSLADGAGYSDDVSALGLKNFTDGAVEVFYKIVNADYNSGEAVYGSSTVTVTKAAAVVTFSDLTQEADYSPSHAAAVTGAYATLQSGETYDGSFVYRYRKVVSGSATGEYINGLPQNAGTYLVYAEVSDPAGNYNAVWSEESASVTLTISPIEGLAALVTAENASFGYDGAAHNISISAPENAVIGYSVDPLETRTYAAALTGNINATEALENGCLVVYYKVTDSNYTDVVAGSRLLTITKTTPTLSFEQPEQTPVFTGEACAVTAPVNNVVTSFANSYAVTYSYRKNGTSQWVDGTPINVGRYTLRATLTFSDENPTNYTKQVVTADTALRVTEKNYEFVVANVDVFYDGLPHNISITGVPAGTTLVYSTSLYGTYSADLSFTNAMDATTIYYRASNPNYGGALSSGSATLRIKKYVPSLSFATDAASPVYTGDPLAVTPTVGLTAGEVFAGTISYSYIESGEIDSVDGLPTDAGTYTVYASIPETTNYEGKIFSKEVTIAKLSLGAITVGSCNFTYDTLAKVIPFNGLPSQGVTVTYSLASGGEYTDMLFINVMDRTVYYKITKIDQTDPNMENEATGSFRIVIAKADPSVTELSAGEITFGDALSASAISGAATIPFGDGTKTVTGTFSWNSAAIAPAVADSEATLYNVTFTPDDENVKTLTNLTATLKVNPAAAAITLPAAQSAVYTGANILASALEAPVTDPAGIAFSYKYRIKGMNGEYTDGLPMNVGRYEVKAVITDSNYIAAESRICALAITDGDVGAEDLFAYASEYYGKGISVTAPEGAEILYSLDGIEFSAENPQFYEISVNTVYYKATFSPEGGSERTVYGNAVVTLTEAPKPSYTVTIIPDGGLDIGGGGAGETGDKPGSGNKPSGDKDTIGSDELEELKNSGEDKVIPIGDDKSWTIHGGTVTETGATLLGFEVTGEGSGIIPGLGENDKVFRISFDEKRELGFTADITFRIGAGFDGKSADVYTTDISGTPVKLGSVTVNGEFVTITGVTSTLNDYYLVIAGETVSSGESGDPPTGVALPLSAFLAAGAVLALTIALKKRKRV